MSVSTWSSNADHPISDTTESPPDFNPPSEGGVITFLVEVDCNEVYLSYMTSIKPTVKRIFFELRSQFHLKHYFFFIH